MYCSMARRRFGKKRDDVLEWLQRHTNFRMITEALQNRRALPLGGSDWLCEAAAQT